MKTLLALIALSFAGFAFADGATQAAPAASSAVRQWQQASTDAHRRALTRGHVVVNRPVCYPQLTKRCYVEK